MRKLTFIPFIIVRHRVIQRNYNKVDIAGFKFPVPPRQIPQPREYLLCQIPHSLGTSNGQMLPGGGGGGWRGGEGGGIEVLPVKQSPLPGSLFRLLI